MNQSTSCLQPNDIGSLFDGDVTPDESGRLESHLAECSTCRERIEQTIGSKQWWSDVQQSLRSPDPMSEFAEWSSNDMAFSNESGTTCVHSGDAPRHPTQHLLGLLGPSDDPQMLGRIGGYEITGLLGQGGMGVVFKGFDRSLNRFVAIKMLLPHLATSGAARKRFAREAQAVAAVVDDHVMPVHFVGEWQGIPYLVMTYSKGVTLQSRLNDNGPLELKEILRIGLQAARGLAAAHAQGLVHRDVKPANIFLSENVERVQLMDFGLARAADDASLTRTGILAGTPQYMSPEQARAEQVDHLSDLFSLGSVIYSMCTGRPPFRADSSHSVLRLITDNEPRPIREINPDIPNWLCRIVDRLMAKQAAGRYESAEQIADVLEKCLAHVQCPETDALPESVQPNRKKSKLIVAITTTCFAMAAFLGLAMFASPEHDVAGKWQGETGGVVELHQVKARVLEGTYSNAFGDEQGDLRMKWSRIERRYKGTWGKGEDRFGKISIRRVGEKIRGAWTTKDSADIAADVPELGDFVWTRAATADQKHAGEGTSDSNYYGSQSSSHSPKTAILTSPYWKRNFRSDHGVTIAQAKDGRIAVATAVEEQTDSNAGVEGIVIRHAVEVLEANSMGETLRFEIDPTIPFGQTSTLSFSPNGNYLALGTQNGLVSVFDAASGKVHLSLASPAAKSSTSKKQAREEDGNGKRVGRVTAMAFSPDGKLLAFCGDRLRPNARRSRRSSNGDAVVQVWDVERGILQYEFDGLSVATDLTFSPSGKYLACAGNWANNDEDGTGVVVLNAADGRRVVRKATTANGGTRFVAYSPKGRFLTCEHHFDNETRTTIRLWDNRTLGQHSVSEYASHANFAEGGKLVAALCRSKSVRFLSADRLRQLHEVDLDENVNWSDFVFSKYDNRFVVAGMDKSGDARVELWRYEAVDREGTDALTTQRSMYWADDRRKDGHSELLQTVDGVLMMLRGVGTHIPPQLRMDIEQLMIRILSCEGHEALDAEQLLADEQAALLVTKSIRDDGGSHIVAEVQFKKRDDNSWDPVELEVKSADQVERDIVDFLEEFPNAKPVSLRHDNLLGRLQGRWQLTRQVQPEGDNDQPLPNGSLVTVKGDQLIPDGYSRSMRIEIDDTQSPPYFDTYEGNGVSVGRCVLEGDTWKVCAGDGSDVDTAFSQSPFLRRPDQVEPNPKWMYLEFKRVTESAKARSATKADPNDRKDREAQGNRKNAPKNGPPFASPRAALTAYLTTLKRRDREGFADTILDDSDSKYATALFDSQNAIMRLHDAVVRQFGSTGWSELEDREHAMIDALCLKDVETFLININDDSANVEGSPTNVILKKRRVDGWKIDVESSLRTRAKRVGVTPGNLVDVMNDLSKVFMVFSGQVSAYGDAEALDVAMGKALEKVLRTSAVKPRVTIDLNGLYWDAADARFRVRRKKESSERGSLRQSENSQSDKPAERVSLVDTKVGICQIAPCIEERKLEKIAEPIKAVERALLPVSYSFRGKGGQVIVDSGTHRMFALPKPTKVFVYHEDAGKSPATSESEPTIELRKYADHVLVNWPKDQPCTFTFYATPTAKFYALDDFPERSVYQVVAQTTGYGKPPEPGQFCDLCVSIHDEDPADPEVRTVLSQVPVLSNTDPQPNSTRRRDVIIELLLTDDQIQRVKSYEKQNAFSFRPLP